MLVGNFLGGKTVYVQPCQIVRITGLVFRYEFLECYLGKQYHADCGASDQYRMYTQKYGQDDDACAA